MHTILLSTEWGYTLLEVLSSTTSITQSVDVGHRFAHEGSALLQFGIVGSPGRRSLLVLLAFPPSHGGALSADLEETYGLCGVRPTHLGHRFAYEGSALFQFGIVVSPGRRSASSSFGDPYVSWGTVLCCCFFADMFHRLKLETENRIQFRIFRSKFTVALFNFIVK